MHEPLLHQSLQFTEVLFPQSACVAEAFICIRQFMVNSDHATAG